jgi:hypothetical protein
LLKHISFEIIDQLESMINNLIISINSGSSSEAESIANKLAKARADVQFNLLNKNDDQEKKTTKSRSNSSVTESSNSVLQLVLNNYFSRYFI